MIDKTKHQPGTTDQHDDHHPGHHDDHPPCPEHYHRCYTATFGYTDCPDKCCPEPHKPVTKTLKIPCGSDDPSPQIAAYLAIPGNADDHIVQVLDLGRDGWLLIIDHY